MKVLYLCIGLLLVLNCSAFAVEIKNATAKVEGSRIVLTYDLLGKPGERTANVKVAISMGGERYLPGSIGVTGDFGTKTPVGRGKRIFWDLLKNMPAGYSGTLTYELDADSDSGNDPFNLLGSKSKAKMPVVTQSTVSDPLSRLVWMRTPLSAKYASSVEGATSVVAKLNSSNYLGSNDWRLPKKDELESLLKMLETYGYKTGQSALPYLAQAGFNISNDSKFWSVDKSSIEFNGQEVFVSGSGQYSGSSATIRSVSSSSPSPSRISGRTTRQSTAESYGSGAASANLSVKERSEDSGLYDLVVDTKNGYFYKYSGNGPVSILAVRGNSSTEIYAVSTPVEVSIAP